MVVALHHLVGDLDGDVGVALLSEPIHRVVACSGDAFLVRENRVLAEVEELQVDDHAGDFVSVGRPLLAAPAEGPLAARRRLRGNGQAKLVAGFDDPGDASETVAVEGAVGAEATVVEDAPHPLRAVLGAALPVGDVRPALKGVTALDVQVDHQDALSPILGKTGNVPFGVGLSRFR